MVNGSENPETQFITCPCFRSRLSLAPSLATNHISISALISRWTGCPWNRNFPNDEAASDCSKECDLHCQRQPRLVLAKPETACPVARFTGPLLRAICFCINCEFSKMERNIGGSFLSAISGLLMRFSERETSLTFNNMPFRRGHELHVAWLHRQRMRGFLLHREKKSRVKRVTFES